MSAALAMTTPPDVAARLAHQDAHTAREADRVATVIRGGAPKTTAEVINIPKAPVDPMTRKQAKAFRARVKRAEEKHRAILIQAENAARAERDAEEVAPGVRRRTINDATGNVIRGPMVEADGVTFARVNVVKRLHKVSPKLFTRAHLFAVDRLIRTHEEVAGGVGLGASDYLSKSAGGSPGNGVSEAKHRALMAQVGMRSELDGALAWLGGSGKIIGPVVFDCVSVTKWADREGIDYRVAMGMLLSGLDRLVEFYEPARPEAPQRIRAAVFE